MSTEQDIFYGIDREHVELLMRAARVERSQAIRSFFKRLFRREREAQAWPAPNQAFTVNG